MDQSDQGAPRGVLYVRGGLVESVHTVHAAVVDADGRVVGRVGDPRRVTFYRSAAKPIQALPLVEDGAAERLALGGEELALCCASHNAEPGHVETVRRILRKLGLGEDDLECGPHLPLREEEAHRLLGERGRPGRLHNNCSGKHAGMLALARHHGWETEGYTRADHPVQRRMLEEVSRWSGLDAAEIATGTDGCGVVAFAVPLDRMALSFARFATEARDGATGAGRIVDAMRTHAWHVAGTDRLCTAVMEAGRHTEAGGPTEAARPTEAGGANTEAGGPTEAGGLTEAGGHTREAPAVEHDGAGLFAKTGAEGVYCAGLPGRGLGVALKVEDGARRAGDVALMRILDELEAWDGLPPRVDGALERFRRPPVRNTLDAQVGELVASFEVERCG